jgi:hypothetical protein
MPRRADRSLAIEWLEKYVVKLRKNAIEREVFDEQDSIQDDEDVHTSLILKRMKRTRYLFRKPTYRKRRNRFDLEDCLSEDSDNFNDEEFLFSFRITRESFFLLLEEMKTKRAFMYSGKYKKPRPIAYQLLVFLYRVGREGTAGGSLAVASFFGIGKGSVNNYVRRCTQALHEIKDEVIYWPDQEEKNDMKSRLCSHGFRHCVGIIDGTLVVLDFKPEKYHECYYSRKSCYAINVMVVCDDRKRITYYNAGWPGSTHDNRVWRNSRLFRKREEYFSYLEYILGDSAYSSSSVMVQAFKKHAATAYLPRDQENFNTLLAQVRIASEHCIGILKGRFQCLKRNNIKLKNGRKEVKEVVDLIGACMVIHNLLINYEEDELPKEWYWELEDEIDWTLYDEEEQEIEDIAAEDANRRSGVFHSIVNNFFI